MLFLSCSMVTVLSVIVIVGYILFAAAPVLGREGLGFIFGSTWDYGSHQFGIWSFIVSTLMVTVATIRTRCSAEPCHRALPLGVGPAMARSGSQDAHRTAGGDTISRVRYLRLFCPAELFQ